MAKTANKITKKTSHEFKGRPVIQKNAKETYVITRRGGKTVRDTFLDGKKVKTEPC